MTAHITPLRSAAESQLIEAFDKARADLPEAVAGAQDRQQAFAAFLGSGLPTRRIEAWHYTDLRALLREALPFAAAPDAAALEQAKAELDLVAVEGCVRLVLVDGFFAPQLSDLDALPPGVRASSMAEATDAGSAGTAVRVEAAGADPMLALNTAFARDGLRLIVADGTKVARPLCLYSLRTRHKPTASAARSRVVVGAGAALQLIEVHAGGPSGQSQSNDALEFSLGERARVEHSVVQRLAAGAVAVASVVARLERHAAFESFALVTGAAVSRRQFFVRLDGSHGSVGLSGVSLLGNRQHADTTLVVDHASVSGKSREFFRHIVDDDATGIYQGKVIVRPGAQKTDGGMRSNAILLSEGAVMNNKPELEIFADDVVCGHGATCGALDEDQLFYLMARGLPRQDAEALLLEAFAGEAIDLVGHEGLREAMRTSVHEWLMARTVAGPLSGGDEVGPAERAVLGDVERVNR